MSSYTEYDLERDLRDARRARARAGHRSDGHAHRADGAMAYIRSRTTDHWIMFAAGLVVGAILF